MFFPSPPPPPIKSKTSKLPDLIMKLLTSFSLHCVLAVSSLPKAIATNNPYVTNPYQSVGDGPRCVTDFQEGAKVDYFPVKVDASDLGAESWQVSVN